MTATTDITPELREEAVRRLRNKQDTESQIRQEIDELREGDRR